MIGFAKLNYTQFRAGLESLCPVPTSYVLCQNTPAEDKQIVVGHQKQASAEGGGSTSSIKNFSDLRPYWWQVFSINCIYRCFRKHGRPCFTSILVIHFLCWRSEHWFLHDIFGQNDPLGIHLIFWWWTLGFEFVNHPIRSIYFGFVMKRFRILMSNFCGF